MLRLCDIDMFRARRLALWAHTGVGAHCFWRSPLPARQCAYCCVLLALSALSQVGAYVLLKKRGGGKAVYHQYTPETMEGGRSMCGPVKAVGAGG
jgi:hypothetical protein